MIKKLFLYTSLASAIGLPYLASTGGEWIKSVQTRFAGSGEEAKTASVSLPANTAGMTLEKSAVTGIPGLPDSPAAKAPLEGQATHDLSEVIRFDVTPGWVMARWPRVTSGLAEIDLQGYRVPLVTGTREDDLAGSLTYYFDKEQHVKFITYRGTTGDPQKLIGLVTSRYSFKQEPVNDPGLLLYQVKWNGKPMSELRVRPARIVRASQPRSRFDVELAMKRP